MDQQIENLLQRLGVGNPYRVVDRRILQIGGNPGLANAFGD
ncbi:MAG: hypothetical protein WDN04_25375 [Rhodospirillales bacterium]